MIVRKDLKRLARERLKDAKTLSIGKRHDGALYICGYAVELALKYRICKSLHWPDFPFSESEFKNYHNFKTHDLEVLLRLSGVEKRVKTKYFAHWSAVSMWDPTSRYNIKKKVNKSDAELMIKSAEALLKIL